MPARPLGAALAAACLAFLVCLPAQAREDRRTRSSGLTVGEYAYEKLSKAQELLREEQYAEATEVLGSVAMKKLNKHERALFYQTRAYLEASQEQWEPATRSFEASLADEALAPGALLTTRFNLAQIYMLLERYDDAATMLERWFAEAENPTAQAHYVLGTAYALGKRYDKALAPAEKAVAMTDTPKEPWLQLLLTLYFDAQQYEKLATTLERLVMLYPKKSYWLQLAAVYGQLGRDRKSLAVLQLAYEQGLLSEDSELRRLGQLYLYHELPYRAALVLEKGLEEGVIESDRKAWELLANSWIQARDYDRAIPHLERAAELAEEGALFLRLGQLHLERERWSQAEKAFQQAVDRGGLDDEGSAWVLLGVSRLNAGRVERASRAFAKAQRYESTRESAGRWLKHVERERATAAARAGG